MASKSPLQEAIDRLSPKRPAFREEDERDEERARLALEVALVRGLDDEQRAEHMRNVYAFMEAEARNLADVLLGARKVVKASNCECGACPTCELREALHSTAPTMRTLVEPRRFRGVRREWEANQMGLVYGRVCSGGRRIGSIRMGEHVGCGGCVRCKALVRYLREQDERLAKGDT